jgi:endonuclease-3
MMFYICSLSSMQLGLDIGATATFADIRDALRPALGTYALLKPLSPASQLVKAMISSRTQDAVSHAAFGRVAARFRTLSALAGASACEIEAVIADVRWPDRKAAQLEAVFAILSASHPHYDLRFLRRGSVVQALAWLEALPGVGRKISAATLNFSVLHMPALVIDTHVLRVLQRLRLVDPMAGTAKAYDTVMPALGLWSAAELQDLHVLVKRLGQTFCRSHDPHCAHCPLRAQCPGHRAGGGTPFQPRTHTDPPGREGLSRSRT